MRFEQTRRDSQSGKKVLISGNFFDSRNFQIIIVTYFGLKFVIIFETQTVKNLIKIVHVNAENLINEIF